MAVEDVHVQTVGKVVHQDVVVQRLRPHHTIRWAHLLLEKKKKGSEV